jgi:hypothetical protein
VKQQQIYSRWEYFLGDKTSDELFSHYKQFEKVFREDGVQVGGISVAMNVLMNTAIILSYDEESEVLLTLKLAGTNILQHHRYIQIEESTT